jgi:hypothetical protein
MRRMPSLLLALACIGPLAGCASSPGIPDHFGLVASAAEESTPLGGEALALRRRELRRAQRDMAHFRTTLETLRVHADRSGQILFSQFLDAYMGVHLTPLLAGEWQSRHPELMALDAGLRLAQAEVLTHMRAPRRVQEVLDELARRFPGRDAMLVEYPVGSQTTLAEALRQMRERKWRG